MRKYLFRLPILLVPALFAYLGVFYRDFIYFGVSAISLLIAFLVIFPHFLATNLKVPKIKKLEFTLKRSKAEKLSIEKLNLGQYLKTAIILLGLFTLLFTYVSIFKLTNLGNNNNILISYFLNQLHFIGSLRSYIGIGILLISLIIFKINVGNKKLAPKMTVKEGLVSVGTTLVTLFLGLSLALIVTGVIGLIQLNAVSINFRLNPQHNGLITEKQKIIDSLKSMDKAPVIIPYTPSDQNKLLIALAISNQTSNSFYAKAIVSQIPSLLVVPLQLPNNSVFMLNNLLVVKNINPSDIEPLSPYIGYLLVKTYFDGRLIKSYPIVKLMGRQEYLDYRVSQFNQKISNVNTAIQNLEDEISTYYGRIQSDKNKIASWQDYISTENSYKSSAYNDCMSNYIYLIYGTTPDSSYCQNQASQLSSTYDSNISQANQNIDALNQDIKNVQYYLSLDQDLESYAKSYIASLQQAKDNTPQELGIFEDNNKIRLAIDETSKNVIVDYFETLSHEYLHYASYVNKDQTLKYSFFEEGLTEYFARQVAKKEFGINTHMGYPVLVALVKEMMKKIPSKTLEDIYFTKDETRLEAELTNAYGEKFFSDFEPYFDYLGDLPPRDALSVANSMLLRMGSKSIKESDLYSSVDTAN